MKYLFLFFLTTLCANAETLYVSQSGSGSGTGADAGNRASASWFNTAANWGGGAGEVDAGDTVSISGTITTTLSLQANGSYGNPITILFESGAKLSQAASTLMGAQNRSYFVIDGGTDGVLENTDNGTGLGSSTSTSGIYASGASNFEIKNLFIKDLYRHTHTNDGSIDFTSQGGIYFNGVSGTNSIHNITFSNVCWCVNMQGASGVLNLYSNIFQNYDHGFGGGGGLSGLNIYNNHFGSTSNWDTTINSYHHDGIHTYWAPGGSLHNARIYNNLFDGDWGINNTAHLFFEQNYSTRLATEATNWWVYNNVHIQKAGNYLNNGFMVFIGNNGVVANNTYIGTSVALQTAVSVSGTNTLFKNNVISGVNRFVDATGSFTNSGDGLGTNIYAAVVAGGNTPFKLNSPTYATLALWRTATGGDAASSQVSDALLGVTGVPTSSSLTVNAGFDLSAYFTTDADGNTRTGTWDLGAFEYIAPSTTYRGFSFGSGVKLIGPGSVRQ
jgi:hypothetical protein